jgi:hypothetical protein
MPKGVYPRQPGLTRTRRKPLRPVEERFWEKVERNGPVPAIRPDLGPCWLWVGARSKVGYGVFNAGAGKWSSAHRWSFHFHGRTAPVGLVLDHLCRVRLCVNPDHLEPVTDGENVRRGDAAQPRVCTHGEADRCYRKDRPGRWNCRACTRERRRAAA